VSIGTGALPGPYGLGTTAQVGASRQLSDAPVINRSITINDTPILLGTDLFTIGPIRLTSCCSA